MPDILRRHAFLLLFLWVSVPVWLLVPSVQAEDAPQVRKDYPQQYIVVKGDTLWDISGRFLEKPWRWPEIWRGNPQIENPHLIYPGDVITLIWENGLPVLVAGEGARPVVDRRVKLSPQIGITPRSDAAVHTIPLDAIHHFLDHPKLLATDDLEAMPYIVDNLEESNFATLGDRVYVRGLAENAPSGVRYSVYTKGDEYRSPSSGEVFGYEAIHVGDVMLQKSGDPASAVVVDSNREISAGDRLLVRDKAEYSNSDFIPRQPDIEVDGHIISSVSESLLVGKYSIVVLDVGGEQGLESGDVLGIYEEGKLVGDRVELRAARDYSDDVYVSGNLAIDTGHAVRLPDEQSGVLMVFRVLDRISYAIVLEATRPVRVPARISTL